MKTEWFYVGQDIQIQTEDRNFEVGELFDSLEDLITVDEINPNSGEHWLENEGNLFQFTSTDFDQLKDKGVCRIYYIGTIDENVDLSIEGDRDFMNWYKS